MLHIYQHYHSVNLYIYIYIYVDFFLDCGIVVCTILILMCFVNFCSLKLTYHALMNTDSHNNYISLM